MMNRDRLVETKQRWAREGRLMVPSSALRGEPSRLPPGQHLVRDWPVLDLGDQPNLRPADWHLSIGGSVAKTAELGWADLLKLGTTERVGDIHCVTGWSRYDNRWSGVSTRAIVDLVRPRGSFVMLRSYDSYATCLSLNDFCHEDALLATHWEGEPLSRAHGGPVRLILPHLYLWKSAKWLKSLSFVDKAARGYWEARGYHERGDPWQQQRYGSDR